MPTSPCAASAGCRKNAGVPVEASVDAILFAICPDLPTPVTITRPDECITSLHAFSNADASNLSKLDRIAFTSISNVLCALLMNDPILRGSFHGISHFKQAFDQPLQIGKR